MHPCLDFAILMKHFSSDGQPPAGKVQVPRAEELGAIMGRQDAWRMSISNQSVYQGYSLDAGNGFQVSFRHYITSPPIKIMVFWLGKFLFTSLAKNTCSHKSRIVLGKLFK